MADFITSVWRCCRLSVAGRSLALVLLVAGSFCSSPCRADPGDFAAMPGLWKIVTTPVDHGHRGKPVIEWRCVDEGADPWTAFAVIPLPALATCQRSNQHRSSTELTWAMSCGGNSQGRGRVGFDSAEHYTASIVLQDRGEIVQVEGQRRAACTGPSD
jgi:Protein of unknown function (DUF3617).